MNNKDVIDKLQAYFLQQDPQVLTRLTANMMVDFHRLYSIESLPFEEVECLFQRIERNALSLRDFVENGPKGPLTMGPLK
jgi:hypothetical protein